MSKREEWMMSHVVPSCSGWTLWIGPRLELPLGFPQGQTELLTLDLWPEKWSWYFESCAPRLLFVFGVQKNGVDILSHEHPDSLFPSLCNCKCKMLQQIEQDVAGQEEARLSCKYNKKTRRRKKGKSITTYWNAQHAKFGRRRVEGRRRLGAAGLQVAKSAILPFRFS